MEIVTKCKTIEEALFYLRKTIEESWSRRTLVDCIKANLYQSSGNALTNFAEKLPAIQGKLAQEIVKDTYNFGFVSLPVGYDEEELEAALEQNITRFLLWTAPGGLPTFSSGWGVSSARAMKMRRWKSIGM